MFKLALLAIVLSGCVTIKVEPANCPAPAQPIIRFGESTCCMPTTPPTSSLQNFLAPDSGGTITLSPYGSTLTYP